MRDIVVNALGPQDHARWAELWRGYLEFYETALPPEIFEHTWRRFDRDGKPDPRARRAARR